MMPTAMISPLPKTSDFPESLPKEGALSLELHEGVPTLRASKSVQSRIDMLLRKQQTQPLSAEEENDLDRYEAIDDYISLLNRISRNLFALEGDGGKIAGIEGAVPGIGVTTRIPVVYIVEPKEVA